MKPNIHSLYLRFCLVILGTSTCFTGCAFAAQIDIKQRGLSKQQAETVSLWVTQSIEAVEQILSPIPMDTLKVEVTKQRYAREPVPYGQVDRGSPTKVKLQVNANASLQEFVDDWTLYHELSHLYLPYLDTPSFWLNEGFATYMQYLTMFGAKVIDQSQYEARMQDGFNRGKARTRSHPGRLSDVADDMWNRGAFTRVYWSGAAYFAEVDRALITQGTDLTQVIGQYSQCCLRQSSSGWQLVKQLDRVSHSQIFTNTYSRYYQRRDFPSISRGTLHKISQHYDQKYDKKITKVSAVELTYDKYMKHNQTE